MSEQENNPMRVAICIGTYKRPELLRELLLGISRQTFRKEPAPEIEIIVVDNDPLGTAEPFCSSAKLPWVLKYFVEQRRGITHVRNRGLQEAGGADFIAFIDDDEVPTPQWLDELLATQQLFGADVVAGPVLPQFAREAPEWVKSSRLFHRPTFSTGQSIELCSTNNALVKREVFLRVPTFDERFNLSGGEDTHFFVRVRKAGCSMIWSQEAIVLEPITPERTRFTWILRRGYQCGNTWSFCELSLDDQLRTRALRALKASGHVAKGLVLTAAAIFEGRAALARSLQTICLGLGMLTGVAGHKFLAYRFPNVSLASKATDFTEHAKA
jgi:succinoglycan biosynthesis protein ExoM